jgi:hypothetical protein
MRSAAIVVRELVREFEGGRAVNNQVSEAVTALTHQGEMELEAIAKRLEQEYQQRQGVMAEEWGQLEEAVRSIFSEAVQEYVLVPAAHVTAFEEWAGNVNLVTVMIEVPGYAPIGAEAMKKDGQWIQIVDKRRYHEFYIIPVACNDFEYGVIWDWRSEVDETNSLMIALALAEKRGREYAELVQAG